MRESSLEPQYICVRRGTFTFTHAILDKPSFEPNAELEIIQCHSPIDPDTGISKRCPHGYVAVWDKYNGV